MIALVRSSDFRPCPRMQKYINYLEEKKIDYVCIGWDRSDCYLSDKDIIYFHKKAKYGMRMKNALNKILWMNFIFRKLVAYRSNINIVHAADYDCAFPALIFTKLFKKKLIFDVCDWIGNSRKDDNILIKTIEAIENIIVNNSQATIVCDEKRIEQISDKVNNKIVVMPNIPDFNFNIIPDNRVITAKLSGKYKNVISYVGTFDYDRGIENLLKFAEMHKDICIFIAGYGVMENKVKSMSENNENIIYLGKVEYNAALNIIAASDILFACYYKSNPVHKYAAPNKFYESLKLGIPIITTENTLVGDNVSTLDTGFVIGEKLNDLEEVFENLNSTNILEKKSLNCTYYWENKYKNCINDFMNLEYIDLLD